MIKQELQKTIKEALAKLGITGGDFSVERPADPKNGDYSTNVALVSAKKSTGINPKVLAGKIVDELAKSDEFLKIVEKMAVAGPGFINIWLTDGALVNEVNKVVGTLDAPRDLLADKKINSEFISANPTGKLHIGHGRGAFYGDMLANILACAGAEVTREFYINDSQDSVQVKELGKTALGKGEQYKTPALEEMIARLDFGGMHEEEAGALLAAAVQKDNRNFIENVLGVKFDVWYSEDEKLRASGASATMLAKLTAAGFVYERDGAQWLKTSEYGDDEDRVVVRSDGSFSYFLADIAYHAEKFSRGYDSVINVWGADHHGHVKRMQAVKHMLGWPGEFKIFVTQLVSLKVDGESKKMSKRAGTVVLLEDLVAEFGIDVVRWFFAEKSLGTHMEFDAALAREQSAKNPVYYVQYAHARIASIIEKSKCKNQKSKIQIKIEKFDHESARSLAKKIVGFSEVVDDISLDYQIQKLTTYVYELAQAFSAFYRDVKIIEENGVNHEALALAVATKAVIKKSLALLGISAPNSM
ncbi:MAG: arginine--tRNA ligase [Candidatus Niyogibacteria bacterium]|nr:arginine--tRNA ligase [Candidatus Niyogibacteria bacterium]